MSFEFSPTGYAALLSALRAKGYQPRRFADADPARRDLILRHDIDFSLDAARIMAEQERERGFISTYFVLLRTEFYNALSAAGFAAMRHILECGHDIGLHFDMTLYPDPSKHDEAIKRECGLLEAALGRPVSVLSLHRPAANRVGESDRLGGRLNAYGPRFIKQMGYCSDSRGAWRFGEPLDHPAVQEGRALQLLTHPFWWQAPTLPPTERLRRFLADRAALLDCELERHCLIHKARHR